MILLIQRVKHARVVVEGEAVGAIDQGILALVGLQKEDTEKTVQDGLERLLAYRIFADDAGRMNLSLRDVDGGLLLVSQFTLAADTRRGLRPSFSSAMPPDAAEVLYDYLVRIAGERYHKVASGRFGADMQVELINDGPVTFVL
ncbi:MAG: D-aminoacyl-tRNA deacylase [Gammaproteobacteria bacterium]|nr:D-tyrosyl-tRNA(Tyr) deacylase [Pseudomonadales bacterium]MCP5347301.1 D-tyrosyl-tRNA(Tyr) deacylase [Pseudomonadales bacterium]